VYILKTDDNPFRSPGKKILVPLLLLLFGAHLIYYAGFTHDDPFISFRYARNLASNKGLVFNEAERVEGYSNFLFLILLAPAEKIGVEFLGLSKIYGFFSALACLLVFLFFLSSYYPLPKWQHGIAPLLLALSGDMALWAVSGMETALIAFFVTAAWILFCREMKKTGNVFPFSALFFLAAALTRPEGGIYFFCLLPFAFVLLRCKQIPGKYFFSWLLLFLVPFAIYNLWRVSYFGNLLPNTFYAKATGRLSLQADLGVIYLFSFLWHNPCLFLLGAFIPALLKKKWQIERVSAAIIVLAQILFIVVCGGDWMPLSRFMVPVLIPLLFLFQEGLFDTLELLKSRDPFFRLQDALGLLLLLLVLLGIFQERRITRPIVYSVKTHTLYHPHIQIGLWLKDNVPPGSLLAGEEAGIIPFYSQLRFLDLLGIVDPHISRQKGAMHLKHDVNYVLSRNPDYVILYTLNPMEKGEKLKARIASGDRLLESPKFRELYKPIKSFPHGNELIGNDFLTLFKKMK